MHCFGLEYVPLEGFSDTLRFNALLTLMVDLKNNSNAVWKYGCVVRFTVSIFFTLDFTMDFY